MNGDDRVDAVDCLIVQSVLAGRLAAGTAPCLNPALADFDLSGTLNAADALVLAETLAGVVEPGAYDRACFRDLAGRVAQDILRRAIQDAEGMRWINVDENGIASQPGGIWDGAAGIAIFLAALYREVPTAELRQALSETGRWLKSQATAPLAWYGSSLFTGLGSIGWAFLDLWDALGDPAWKDEALAVGTRVEAMMPDNVGLDIFSGAAGDGMFMLRLYTLTGDDRWLEAARRAGDRILAYARPVGEGIKFPVTTEGNFANTIYVGMAHGGAGIGYFFARLARQCPPAEAGAYREAAVKSAQWLREIAGLRNGQVTWYRREPDQLNQYQYHWCHGSPGIGLFFGELYRLTGNWADLDEAQRCGDATQAVTSASYMTCFCHGISGNAGLFLQLYRETADPRWLSRARGFARMVWLLRDEVGGLPQWESGDASPSRNVPLWLGSAGVGYLFLALAEPGRILLPVTE